MEQPKFVAHNEIEVSVAIEVSKGGVRTFNLEGGQRNPIVIHLVEARLIRRADVAVRRHEGWGLVNSLVPLLVGDGQVKPPVAVEIHQHGVGPPAHVNHVALEVGTVLKRPQGGVFCPGILEPMNPRIVVGLKRGVGGENQVFGPVEVHVEVKCGREPRQMDRLVAPQVGWELGVQKHRTV